MLNSLLPDRPLSEQMAGEVRVRIGGREYLLPTLTRRQNRRWKDQLNDRLGGAFAGLKTLDDPGAVMQALDGVGDLVPELVREYDQTGVIPPDDDPALERDTDREWLQALLACAAAAYPFVGLALEAQRQQPTVAPQPGDASPPTTIGHEPTNSQPASGDGSPSS